VIIVAVCSSHADVAAAVVVTIASLASWLVVHVNVLEMSLEHANVCKSFPAFDTLMSLFHHVNRFNVFVEISKQAELFVTNPALVWLFL